MIEQCSFFLPLIFYFHCYLRKFISKINFNTREEFVLNQFERVSNAAFSGLVDEAAYFRGMARKNNLNMQELHQEVLADLDNCVPNEGKEIYHNISLISGIY